MLLDRRRWALPAAFLALALPACAHSRQSPPAKVAVLPLDAVGLPVETVERLRRAFGEQVARAPTLEGFALDQVDAATGRALGCRPISRERLVPCAVRVGAQLGATHAVVGAVGGLGSTYVVQLHLVGVSSGAVIRSLEETLFGSAAHLETVLGSITARLFDLPRRQRWYERWWIWTLVGVSVSAAIVLPLSLRNTNPYHDVTLP